MPTWREEIGGMRMMSMVLRCTSCLFLTAMVSRVKVRSSPPWPCPLIVLYLCVPTPWRLLASLLLSAITEATHVHVPPGFRISSPPSELLASAHEPSGPGPHHSSDLLTAESAPRLCLPLLGTIVAAAESQNAPKVGDSIGLVG